MADAAYLHSLEEPLMGLFKRLLKPSVKNYTRAHYDPLGAIKGAVDDEKDAKKASAAAAAAAALPAPGIQGGLGMPQLNQPPIQYPQLQQSDLPYFQPNPQGYGMGQGGMPFIRNQAMANTLSPLMQQNYGMPMISPYAPGTPNGPPQSAQPYPGAGQFPIMGNPGPQMPGMGRWGVQPIMGGAR